MEREARETTAPIDLGLATARTAGAAMWISSARSIAGSVRDRATTDALGRRGHRAAPAPGATTTGL
jgi:hypothetical protein